MPAKYLKCISSTKKSLKKQHPNWSSEKIKSAAYAICTEQFKKEHNGMTPNEWDKKHGKGSLAGQVDCEAIKTRVFNELWLPDDDITIVNKTEAANVIELIQ